MRTTDQGIIVSGGSRGLGLHLVERFLQQGNRVASFARSRTEHMEHLAAGHPSNFRFEELDATDAGGISRFVAEAAEQFGRIHSVVNNAAMGQDQLLMHTNIENVRTIVETNIIAPTIMTRAAIKHMMLLGGGNICNISSICGSRGYPGLTVYAGSKGYLDAMTRSLAREVGEAGIFVNCVAPGFFESEMSSVLNPEQLATIKRRTPSGVLSDEENIFSVVDLIISGTTNMQGQVVVVDGGISS